MMFFIISKIVWFCLKPSSLIGLAFLVGLIQLMRQRYITGRRWVAGASAALLICGLSPFSDLLFAALEQRFDRPDLSGPGTRVDGLIVLGGSEDSRINVMRELMSLNEAAERLTEAVALSRQFPAARVVFTGGSHAVMMTKLPEGQQAQRFLTALGVDPQRLIIEDQSRNTYENAVFTKAMVQIKPGERWLLITSAWHMPRSMGIFRKAGVDVIPWPVDYRAPEGAALFMPQNSLAQGLNRLDTIAKEYVGLVVYRLTGRSDALFPGQKAVPNV
jgi:uncharacterized SAM-binding protein YcdF (DUF218 family)